MRRLPFGLAIRSARPTTSITALPHAPQLIPRRAAKGDMPASSGQGRKRGATAAAAAAATAASGGAGRSKRGRTSTSASAKGAAGAAPSATAGADAGAAAGKGPPTHGRSRCFGSNSELYARYHDEEWCVPVHDDRLHFELITLEGAQAGLSFETVLKKREGYRARFFNMDPVRCAAMTDAELDEALADPGIVRHRQKVRSVRQNAGVFLEISREFGTFDAYVWGYVGGKQVVNTWRTLAEMPTTTDTAKALSKDLKARGMTFVGPTIAYAYMQAAGLVNDHIKTCWRHGK